MYFAIHVNNKSFTPSSKSLLRIETSLPASELWKVILLYQRKRKSIFSCLNIQYHSTYTTTCLPSINKEHTFVCARCWKFHFCLTVCTKKLMISWLHSWLWANIKFELGDTYPLESIPTISLSFNGVSGNVSLDFFLQFMMWKRNISHSSLNIKMTLFVSITKTVIGPSLPIPRVKNKFSQSSLQFHFPSLQQKTALPNTVF